jgi:hypothetical protein
MLQRYVPALGALTLSLCLEVVGQQTIAKGCETLTTFPPRPEDSQPMPEQLKIPHAPKTARQVSCFRSFGVPDKPDKTAQLDLRDWLWYGLKNAVRHLRNVVPSCSRRAKW